VFLAGGVNDVIGTLPEPSNEPRVLG